MSLRVAMARHGLRVVLHETLTSCDKQMDASDMIDRSDHSSSALSSELAIKSHCSHEVETSPNRDRTELVLTESGSRRVNFAHRSPYKVLPRVKAPQFIGNTVTRPFTK